MGLAQGSLALTLRRPQPLLNSVPPQCHAGGARCARKHQLTPSTGVPAGGCLLGVETPDVGGEDGAPCRAPWVCQAGGWLPPRFGGSTWMQF